MALADGKAVSAINIRTLTETARYATGVETDYVAFTAGRIWFGYADMLAGKWGVGSINPRVRPVTVTLSDTPDTWYGTPMLAASRQGGLVVTEVGSTPNLTATYRVIGDTVRVLAPQQRSWAPPPTRPTIWRIWRSLRMAARS